MTTERIRIDKKLIKKLESEYKTKIIKEYEIIPKISTIITYAILELDALKNMCEYDIKIKKNGNVRYYKIKR